MRILLIHNFYRWRGGEDEFVERLHGMLQERGHVVQLFSARSGEIEHYAFPQRLKIAAESFYSFSTAQRLRQLVQEFHPDVLHVHNVFPVLSPSVYWIASELHLPLVQSVHNFRFICPNGFAFTHGEVCFRCRASHTLHAIRLKCSHGSLSQSALYASVIGIHKYLKTFGERTGRLLPVNRMLAEMLHREFPSARVTLLPNYIETSRYQPRDNFKPSFVYLGRLSEEKGVRTLIQAMRYTDDLSLEVVGSGVLLDELKRDADSIAPGRVTFHGFISGEGRFSLLKSATALIMPSQSHDSWPMAVLESLALGVPVIASRQGGLPDLVRDGETGLLFEAGHAEQLALAMQKLAESPDLAKQMGLAARHSAETEFDVDVYYQKLIGIYQQEIEWQC